MADWFYRYTDDPQEKSQLDSERKIESINSNQTLWATRRYSQAQSANNDLNIGSSPDFRIGPIPDVMMPTFKYGPVPIQPQGGNGGGNGVEVAVSDPIWVFGIWDFNNSDWEEM
ncbi:hypothetical protein ACFQE8_02965 [Salinirubellus sp. GCM10025818]|uniref:hypothetical protein n=1 Tax=Salinirubellus TaxID=2162630 RepID=UPI0030CC1E2A